MKYNEKPISLTDGRTVLLRSTGSKDAEAMLQFLKQTSAETEFLLRYPEEWTISTEEEAALLESEQHSETTLKIAAFANGKIVGTVSINPVGSRFKVRHRAALGIAVLRDYWSCGLGTALISEVLQAIQHTQIQQVELGVFTNNVSAIHLYEKLGFQHMGVIPRAFRLKDGTYCDEAQMYRTL